MTVSVLGARLPATATYAAAVGFSLLLLLAAVGAAFWQADQQRAHNASVRASFEIRAELRRALSTLQDAETGQRGYLLTNDPRYLTPYVSAVANSRSVVAGLETAAEREPRLRVDVARLHVLVDTKLAELASTIDLTQRGRRAQALDIVRSDRGKAVMDEARAIIDRVVDSEGRALNTHLTAAEQGADRLRTIVLVAAMLLFAIGGLMLLTARQAMAELRGSRDEAQAANIAARSELERRRVAETKMVQMQKMEAIGQLTGGVAHDFNNMLAVIISALTLLRRRLERAGHNDIDFMQYIDAAHDGARRAATLTGRLLAFARRSPLAPSVIDVNKMVASMSELLRRTLGEQIDMETVLAGGLWRVLADVSQLENAIINICVNARDAMKDGGKLTIETSNAHLDAAYAHANPDASVGQYVMIAITDTGEGMPADVIARAFEPFFTTKEAGQGTGLGLSHVHGFLKQTGGHVAIYSEVGHGTTIKLYLPRTQRAEDAPTPVNDAAEQTGSADTLILVVEDEERVRLLSVATLRELGYTVLHAPNGHEALERLKENPGVDLLFTDIVMPDMSGRVLADQAKAIYSQIKVLYTTGYTQNAIVHNGVVDADARLILKPYSMDDLARSVRAALDA